jgi:hypothetical protein
MMKRFMRLGFLLSAVVAVALMPGVAWGQNDVDCFVLSPTDPGDGDRVTMTAFDVDGAQIDLNGWTAIETNFAPEGGIFSGDPDCCGCEGCDPVVTAGGEFEFNIKQAWLDGTQWDWFTFNDDGDQWLGIVLSEDGEETHFPFGTTVAEAFAAGGSCAFGPVGPNLSLNVDGSTYAEEGGDISMSANGDMMSPYPLLSRATPVYTHWISMMARKRL